MRGDLYGRCVAEVVAKTVRPAAPGVPTVLNGLADQARSFAANTSVLTVLGRAVVVLLLQCLHRRFL